MLEDSTPEKIKKLSEGYALDIIKKFGKDGKDILYLISGVFLFNDNILKISSSKPLGLDSWF